ncbi:zinc-binding dehydrogenase [Rhodobacter sp. NTK016B]|uniref:alcohol dehydrogenase catalytic domain-containing protein n=1 Tax=Rhodobacter sp. NTK016B TaxID=2759676 RepID=UPI001A8D917C|nr:zinc-binding dehydrogenase [Rhodobacter sp. NTK016B]MBN8293109.1 zinc-binding dehydrogenase [Rhodobacter sp. NTK016B]
MGQVTQALALREGGFAKGPRPQVPGDLHAHLELREIELPEPGEGQVLVEVILSPVNPSDFFYLQGAYGQPRQQGHAAGFEGCGRVIAAGGAAGEKLVGKRVAFLGSGSGSWATHAVAEAALCIPLSDAVRDVDGAALVVNPLTAVALVERGRAGGEAFILNAAASQLGRLMLGLARDEGLKPIAVIRRPGEEDALREAGATEVLVSSEPDFMAKAQAAIKALKPRVLLDAVGDQATADLFFTMPSGAAWVSYGKMSEEAPSLTQMGQFIFMGKTIEGFWLSRELLSAPPERSAKVIAQVQKRFASGAWSTRVAEEIPLDQALDRILPAYASGAGKVMIRP